MRSIRGRLLGWLGFGLLVLFGLAGLVVDRIVTDRLETDFREELDALARTLAAGLELEIDPRYRAEVQRLGALAMPDPKRSEAERAEARRKLRVLAEKAFRIRFALDPERFPAADYGTETPWFYVQDGEANRLAMSRPVDASRDVEGILSSGGKTTPEGLRAGEADGKQMILGQEVIRRAHEVADVRFRDGAWSETWTRIRGDDPTLRKSAWVTVARSREGVNRLLGRVRAGMIAAGVALAILIAFGSWWIVRRGLAPVTGLSEQVAALDAQSLGQRIDESSLPEELAPIARQLNAALERIEHSVDRERRTAAHIAHELRTPIAELQSITEIAAKWPDEAELQARAVKDSHDVALHMGRVVAALLKVARAGSGEAPLTLDALDVVPVVRRAWEGLGAAAGERNQTLDDVLPETLDVQSDRDVAEAVVASLLKNAIQHAPPGSTVRVGAAEVNGRRVLTIANPAPDLGADDVLHMAEAFWRKDAARTHSDEGGLGLTLAFELCRGAGIELTPRLEGGQLVLTLGFPVAG